MRARFTDPAYYLDAHVLDRIAQDPSIAASIKDMATRPPEGLPFRVDVGPPRDPELATPEALARLNARLQIIDVQAEPFAGYEHLWTVRVPQSRLDFVHLALTGPYGFSSRPDMTALAGELAELSLSQLEGLRQCFTETQEHVRAGLARLQGEPLPQSSTSPSDMLHYVVDTEVQSMTYHLSHLASLDEFVAREQQRRSAHPD